MHSACIARLISNYSWLKLQAIIYSQINANNCLEWGKTISEEDFYDDITSVHSIHERLIEDPECVIGELYFSFIKSLIVNFSSNLEFFLKDSLKLNMMRNYSLFKKILNDTKTVVNPIDILEVEDIDELRKKYIIQLSEHICSGELWKAKFKKYIGFLDLSKNLVNEEINGRIDSIWQARNDIAHANTCDLRLSYDKDTYVFNKNMGAEEYTKFALLFVSLVDDVIAFLSKVDKLSLEKWEATDATLLYKHK